MASIRCCKAGFLRELHEELYRLVSDAILRVIEIDSRRFGSQAPATLIVIREQTSQMQVRGLFDGL
jgi:hypothetical protein